MRNLLINNKIFSGVSKISIRDEDGVRRHIYAEEGSPIEVATLEELQNVNVIDNAGKIYKYVGETTGEFTNGQLYSVLLVSTGENVVKVDLNNDGLPWTDDIPGVILKFPFEHNFTVGQQVDFVYLADGVEKTIPLYYVEVDMDGITVQTLSNTQEMGDVIVLEENGEDKLVGMFYFNIAPDDNREMTNGQTWMFAPEGISYNTIEVVSVGGIKNPVKARLQPLYGLDALTTEPTAKDIVEDVIAYNSKGQRVIGKLTNPIKVETEEEMDALLQESNWGNVYLYKGSTTSDGRYKNSCLYKKDSDSFVLLEALLDRDDYATPDDVVHGKIFYTSSGYHSGDLKEPREIKTEAEMDELFRGYQALRVFRYVGDTTNKYEKDGIYKNFYDYYLYDSQQRWYGSEQLMTLRDFLSFNWLNESTRLILPSSEVDYYNLRDVAKAYGYGRELDEDTGLYDRFNNSIETIEFSNEVSPPALYSLDLSGFRALKTLIIRCRTAKAEIKYSGYPGLSLANTPIANGEGYIYVPDELVDSYKADNSNEYRDWTAWADRIKGLSELEEV